VVQENKQKQAQSQVSTSHRKWGYQVDVLTLILCARIKKLKLGWIEETSCIVDFNVYYKIKISCDIFHDDDGKWVILRL
jgi:hypothetical protein